MNLEDAINIKVESWKYTPSAEQVLNNIDLTIKKQEFVAIMGPTGAGKSSLCLLLNGSIPQFYEEGEFIGEVIVDGLNTLEHPIQEIATTVGLIFQDAESQIFANVVEEDVAFGPCNLGLPREEVIARIDHAISSMGIETLKHRKTKTLSGGQKQRLAMAGVFAMLPEVLVLDEPTAELDPLGEHLVLQIISELRDKGRTMLLVEQKANTVVEFAERLIVMDKGQIIFDGNTKEIFYDHYDELIDIGINLPTSVNVIKTLESISGVHFETQPLHLEETKDEIVKFISNGHKNSIDIKTNTSDQALGLSTQSSASQETATLFKNLEVYQGSEIIKLDNIVFDYDEKVRALDHVSFSIKTGDFVAFVGINGAGKSTLTKVLNGLLTPTSGSISLMDFENNLDPTELSSHIGYCFQNPDHQLFSDNVFNEVAFGLKNRGYDEDVIKDRVEKILELTGLAGTEEKAPFTLSKGERQRVALASTIVLSPSILIIDEPTTGLDHHESRKIMGIIEEINKLGATVLFVSHDMELVTNYANRVILMADGKIVDDGSPNEVLSDEDFIRKAGILPPNTIKLAKMINQDVDGFPVNLNKIDELCQAILSFAAKGKGK
jgi:energy-coupling factor transport system ATP-binding protein